MRDDGRLICGEYADDLFIPTSYEGEAEAAIDIATVTAEELLEIPPGNLAQGTPAQGTLAQGIRPQQDVLDHLHSLATRKTFGGLTPAASSPVRTRPGQRVGNVHSFMSKFDFDSE